MTLLPSAAGIRVNSTLLATVTYNIAASLLDLEFCDGAIYQYSAVSEMVYHELLAADSKGAYFNRRIRKHFSHRCIRKPQ